MVINMTKEIPVYLFTGFLEAGKTRFIQGTLEDSRFNKGEPTLLLACEEGFDEYDPSAFSGSNVYIERIDSASKLSPERLALLCNIHECERVLVEYNGMWMLDELYTNMPEGWVVVQEFMFVDGGSFLSYNANMRQLVFDKLKSSDMVVFNRMSDSLDREEFHRIVRGANRGCDIAYEFSDGRVEFDDIEDPLPFDLNADIISVEDSDFALWYRDLSEEMEKYAGKTVRFKGYVGKRGDLPSDTFIIGRRIMSCCVDDIQYAGLICSREGADALAEGEWIDLTAKIMLQTHPAYGRRGPVLTAVAIEKTSPPRQEVATFY